MTNIERTGWSDTQSPIRHREIVVFKGSLNVRVMHEFNDLFADGGVIDQEFRKRGWKYPSGHFKYPIEGRVTKNQLTENISEITFVYFRTDL